MVRKRIMDGNFLFARLPVDRWSSPAEMVEADLRNLFLVYALEPVPPAACRLAEELERRLEAHEGAAESGSDGDGGSAPDEKLGESLAAAGASARKSPYH